MSHSPKVRTKKVDYAPFVLIKAKNLDKIFFIKVYEKADKNNDKKFIVNI